MGCLSLVDFLSSLFCLSLALNPCTTQLAPCWAHFSAELQVMAGLPEGPTEAAALKIKKARKAQLLSQCWGGFGNDSVILSGR